jgi:hypothetical protein
VFDFLEKNTSSKDDPKIQLEEIEQLVFSAYHYRKIKEKLAERLDFTLPSQEPVKKQNKPTTTNLEPAKSKFVKDNKAKI